MSDEKSTTATSEAPEKGPGRPPHEPTQSGRRQVSTWAAGGMSQEKIALALDIDPKTLGKYYERELTVEAARKQGRVIEALYKQATAKEGGKIAAAKQFLRRAEMDPETVEKPQAAPSKKSELGKKLQRLIDAKTPDGDGGIWDEIDAARTAGEVPSSDTKQ